MARMARYVHLIVAAVFLAAAPGCDLARQLQPPAVTDTTIQWVAGAPRRLSARIDQSGAYEITDVFVRYTRHRWPGHQAANEFPATPVSDGSDTFVASPPDAAGAPRGDHLFWEWFVEYRLPDGNDIETVVRGRQSTRDGGRPGLVRRQLGGGSSARHLDRTCPGEVASQPISALRESLGLTVDLLNLVTLALR